MTDPLDSYLDHDHQTSDTLAAHREQAAELPERLMAFWRTLAANPVEKNTLAIERWLASYAVANGAREDTVFLLVREVLRAHGDQPDVRESYATLLEDLRRRAAEQAQFERTD